MSPTLSILCWEPGAESSTCSTDRLCLSLASPFLLLLGWLCLDWKHPGNVSLLLSGASLSDRCWGQEGSPEFGNYNRIPLLMLPQESWVFETGLDDQPHGPFPTTWTHAVAPHPHSPSSLRSCWVVWGSLVLAMHIVQAGLKPAILLCRPPLSARIPPCPALLWFPTSLNFWHTTWIEEAGRI